MDELALATRFEQHRPRLRAIAYRVLGSLSDADDAVQDTWLRLARTGDEAIDDLGAWLTTVVSRVSLNQLRARATRSEQSLPAHLPDPVVLPDAPGAVLPEEQAMLADSVGVALLLVLDTLSPVERIAFVLHDSFGIPFDEIADLTGSSPAATRQAASRARRRIQRADLPAPDPDRRRQRAVVDAFFRAANGGDVEGLVAVLHPDAVLRTDIGRGAGTTEVRGADAVAGQAMLFRHPGAELVPATVNGAAGVVVVIAGRPTAVMAFTVTDDRVAAIDAIADPERVARIASAVL